MEMVVGEFALLWSDRYRLGKGGGIERPESTEKRLGESSEVSLIAAAIAALSGATSCIITPRLPAARCPLPARPLGWTG